MHTVVVVMGTVVGGGGCVVTGAGTVVGGAVVGAAPATVVAVATVVTGEVALVDFAGVLGVAWDPRVVARADGAEVLVTDPATAPPGVPGDPTEPGRVVVVRAEDGDDVVEVVEDAACAT
ncbi:MAG: hypothetical protein ACHQFZ_07420 [Acidimicrobiales bacterium]